MLPALPAHTETLKRLLEAYEDPLIRAYSWGRFKILRQRFLEEIGQYLPASGKVLDVGCGFGLFGNYYARRLPGIELEGFDLNAKRVAEANKVAARLGLTNAQFSVGDAAAFSSRGARYAAIYVLDVVHHVPPAAVPALLRSLRDSLLPGGILVVKDLDTTPTYKRVFSHVLDLAMSPSSPPHYWPPDELTGLLRTCGFSVVQHALVDVLPYPHILYVCRHEER